MPGRDDFPAGYRVSSVRAIEAVPDPESVLLICRAWRDQCRTAYIHGLTTACAGRRFAPPLMLKTRRENQKRGQATLRGVCGAARVGVAWKREWTSVLELERD